MRPRNVVIATLLMVGCGTAATVRPRTNVAPPRPSSGALTVEANRNSPPPRPAAEGVEELILLWCSQPGGPACTAAQQELGLWPTPTEAVPDSIREEARDTEDDCNDPEIAPLMQRVTTAIGAGGRWIDHLGRISDRRLISDMFSGSGCTNRPGPTDARVKVHAAWSPDRHRLLVRVWEVGEH